MDEYVMKQKIQEAYMEPQAPEQDPPELSVPIKEGPVMG